MDAEGWGHAVHLGIIAAALLYIVVFDTYCGISGDSRWYGPAAVNAAQVDIGEGEDSTRSRRLQPWGRRSMTWTRRPSPGEIYFANP